MERRTSAVISLVVFTIILTMAAIAQWGYPHGLSYPTGRMEVVSGDDRREQLVPEYRQLPSPLTNPGWVRVLQDCNGIIGTIGGIGWFLSLLSATGSRLRAF